MFEKENNIIPDFSDIPALGDNQGLENYLNNEALASQGLQPVQPQITVPEGQAPVAQPTTPATPTAQAPAAAPAPEQQSAAKGGTITLTREQLSQIIAANGQARQQPAPRQNTPTGYSPQEQQFIAKALAKGFSLGQINNFLETQGRVRVDPALEQRLAGIEQYLRTQEYKAAETTFINKLTEFGNRWGLSEQDLVTFGNEALNHGINIAMDNVNLETVFRAVYPDQYAIRSRRMSPTNSSQIYGGTSIPESNRAHTAKLEDAYVESFLKGAMPNQYDMLNKK